MADKPIEKPVKYFREKYKFNPKESTITPPQKTDEKLENSKGADLKLNLIYTFTKCP